MKLSIVLPAYQEEENLKAILPIIHKEMAPLKDRGLNYEVLVIDTMEPMDDTKKVCEANQALWYPRENGNFYGDAIRTGFDKAQGEYIVIMDADGSHEPKVIKRFLKEMEKGDYDLIIGSRYCKGGYTDNPFILKFMSWILNVSYRIMFGLKVKDVSDSFRMYRKEQVKKLKLECNNFDIVEEILIKLDCSKKHYRIKEVPISFNKRAAGESKRDLFKFVRSYCKTMIRLLRIKRKNAKEKHEG